jgi:hypothetical protein
LARFTARKIDDFPFDSLLYPRGPFRGPLEVLVGHHEVVILGHLTGVAEPRGITMSCFWIRAMMVLGEIVLRFGRRSGPRTIVPKGAYVTTYEIVVPRTLVGE